MAASPPEETSLPPGTDAEIENIYRVLKVFDQTIGTAAAWFNQLGGGPQIKTEMTTDQLLEDEYIEPVEIPTELIVP